MYKIKENLFFTFSGLILLLLIATPNVISIIINFAIGIVFIVAGKYMPIMKEYIKLRSKIVHVLLGVLIDIFVWWSFYEKWKYSSMFLLISNRIGLNHKFFLIIIASIGAMMSAYCCIGIVVVLVNNSRSNVDNRISNVLDSNKVFICCCIITIVGLMCQIYFSFSNDIWLDEAFSLKMIKHSYKEMVLLTAQDVHPPLYYIILKAVVDIINGVFPWISQINVAKMVSIIPGFILMIYSGIVIRMRWGNFISCLFIVCLIGMPQLIFYGVEIRMYSWGLLFVTASFFSMYDIMIHNDRNSWVKFLVFSLLAAYTHYFACISVAFFYLFLFILFMKRNKKALKSWFVVSFFTILGYTPWLFVLIKQLSKIKEGYWISEISFQSIIFYIKFIFERYWLFVLYILSIIICIRKIRNNNSKIMVALGGLMTIFWTVLIGVTVSKLFRPIFISRYVVPSLGCLWFSMIVVLSVQKRVRIKMFIFLAFLTLSCKNIFFFIQKEQTLKMESLKLECLVSQIGEKDNKIITTTSNNNRLLAVRVDANCYLWNKKDSKLSEKVYGNISNIRNVSNIEKWIKSKKKVYLVVNAEESESDIINLFKNNGLELRKIGHYQLEQQIMAYEIRSGD